ncbi:MAG TPA: metalloregulator ArsR/SmtB family transcription factor [Kofleriaceae bacterium]
MAADVLSPVFFALADQTRRGILKHLANGEATVSELAEPYDMTFAAVSKHLRVLERVGLVSRGREAQFRPVRLEAAPLREAATWIDAYQKFWEQNLDSLAAYLDDLQRAESKPKKKGNR